MTPRILPAFLALAAPAILHAKTTAPVPEPAGYKLVWNDEFDKDGDPDPTKWIFETGFVRNKELQWYQAKNASVKGGVLVIEGRRERVKNPDYVAGSKDWRKSREYAEYTSAALETKGRASWTYGRFEVRARIVAKTGLWPAIWTLGDSKGDYGWPKCGEIDLLEYYADNILANVMDGNGKWKTVKTPYRRFSEKDAAWDTKFHVWRMDWDKTAIRLYLDDELLNETPLDKTSGPGGKSPFHSPQFLLLNLAIGSSGGDPSKTKFPSRYEVDYVRVYQKTGDA